jgi:hypothetical protein
MKPSIKAALLSALVFPGLGHFALGRRARGCLFLLPSALCCIYLVQRIIARSSAIVVQIESGTLPLDPQAILAQLSSAPVAGTLGTPALVIATICWVGSVIDAFLIKQ